MGMARDLEHDLPANSSALAMISQTLETTSSQLKDLQNNYQKYKTTKSKATKYKGKLGHEKFRKKESSTSGSRRGRFVKMALMINLLLMFVVFFSPVDLHKRASAHIEMCLENLVAILCT